MDKTSKNFCNNFYNYCTFYLIFCLTFSKEVNLSFKEAYFVKIFGGTNTAHEITFHNNFYIQLPDQKSNSNTEMRTRRDEIFVEISQMKQ